MIKREHRQKKKGRMEKRGAKRGVQEERKEGMGGVCF
jgi:hypothetical protein